jgi:ribosomal protein S18 acetylase RimI-like enzyme
MHDRRNFTCGEPTLDQYFKQQVTQDIKRRVTNCFVVCDKKGEVVGFYTFAATSLPLLELPETLKKRLPRYSSLPAGLIGRLAIHQDFQGQGLGGALIIDAAKRAAYAEPAIFALIVDAKNLAAEIFYEKLGFIRFESKPSMFFIPLASIPA